MKKLARYRQDLTAWKRKMDSMREQLTEPQPEAYGIKSNSELFAARRLREKVLGRNYA